MKGFIEKIPKAELQLHIEGTFEPELMFEIAQRNKVRIPNKSIEDWDEFEEFYASMKSHILYTINFYKQALISKLLFTKMESIKQKTTGHYNGYSEDEYEDLTKLIRDFEITNLTT